MEPTDQAIEGVKTKKRSWGKIIGYVLVVLILLVAAVQYYNAAKYEMLVQVINDNRIGVNPTGDRLDFGDLPKDKNATRVVTLESDGNTSAYVIIWVRGEMADFTKVSRNYFTLEGGKTEKVEFDVHIPNSAQARYYRGKVTIFQIPKIW